MSETKKSKKRYNYFYRGPVMYFDKIVTNNWTGETTATSEAEAKRNLAFRFKQDAGLAKTARITLPGKLVVRERVWDWGKE